jgi:hypothetical protein
MASDVQALRWSSAVMTIRSAGLIRLKPMAGRMTPGLAVCSRSKRMTSRAALCISRLGLEVCRALRRRKRIQLKEVIAVVPLEDAALHTQATDRLAITHSYQLVAARDRSTSTP